MSVRTMLGGIRLSKVILSLAIVCMLIVVWYASDIIPAVYRVRPSLSQLDTFSPHKSATVVRPLPATHTVHYLWCQGKGKFTFSHYLGLLSAVRLLQPIKLVFHYTEMPSTDTYNSWFKIFSDANPTLEMRKTEGTCGSQQMLTTMLDHVSQSGGGAYISDSVFVTKIPPIPPSSLSRPFRAYFSFSDTPKDHTRGMVLLAERLNNKTKNNLVKVISSTKPSCVTPEVYNTNQIGSIVCVKPGETFATPLDFASNTNGAFAELARYVFYGTTQPLTVINGTGEPIPRVSHYIWLSSKTGKYVKEFSFSQFLSVLSALYVGGFRQVWVHGNQEPSGHWWEALKNENVTFVPLERPETVFQKKMTVPAHMSDVLRFLILRKYGGAYQDFDVVWSSRVPDWLLSYPAVACPDWPKHDSWPVTFNMGVMMARRSAPYLDRLLDSYYDYRDGDWNYNAIMMPYRMKELYPETVLVDRHLQVLCCFGQCHAPWHRDYVRSWQDKRPIPPFALPETRAIHVTCPKPAPSLVSPEKLKSGIDMPAQAGRQVLILSGRQKLIQ